MRRYPLDDGTLLLLQEPVARGPATESALAVLFDGRPMIEAGISDTMRSLQEGAVIGPLTTIYVESIEGATARGPTRVASLTDAVVLDRIIVTLQCFLAYSSAISPDRTRRVVLGHSLGGNAALHIAYRRPDPFGAVATGSAALWWPGDDVQMPGSDVVDEVLASTDLRLWMQAGSTELPDLLPLTGTCGSAPTPPVSTSSISSIRVGTSSPRGGAAWSRRCHTCSGSDRSAA
jgi:enterochelin esterase-like enzyme